MTFRDIPDLLPFRELQTRGAVSTGSALLVGFDPPARQDPARVAAVRADPCAALFGKHTGQRLPIAFFSDYNCPNCRVLDAILLEHDAANPGTIRIIRHELPLPGAASTIASQAVLAADRQGGYPQMHDRLMRTRLVMDLDLVMSMADQIGPDGRRLVEDIRSAEIAGALDRAKAIASVFGFYGTPSTVIGRTAFLGAIPAADVAQVIKDELAALPLRC